MTILQHAKTTIDLDRDGLDHIKTEIDTTDEEIMGVLEENNMEVVIGQYTQLDVVLEVLESRTNDYITDTDSNTAEMTIYEVGA